MQSRTEAEKKPCLVISWNTETKVIHYRFGWREREKRMPRSPVNNLVVCMPDFATNLVPHRLLKGPLSEQRIALLAGLVSFSCSCVLRSDQALVQTTIERAIREGNGLVLTCLLDIEIVDVNCPPQFIVPEYVTVTFEHFKIAILEAGCQLHTVDTLLDGRRPQGFTRRESDKIKGWLKQKRAMRDPELKTILKTLDNFQQMSKIKYRQDPDIAFMF
ncbi:hypothetical protein MMC14_008626 [Varicellaria rhodocarpa]|nr:hypothetical protein [Varicellaria rhodocarpa]